MASWAELLTHAEPGEHLVQLYGEDDPLLARNVARYLAEGLRRRDALVVIATPEHVQAIGRHLAEEGAGATLEAERDGRLMFLDARATLDRMLRHGRLDDDLFRQVVGSALDEGRRRSGSGQVRAFGEMVSLLWTEGRRDAAEHLEQLWNSILADRACSLYCAYRIDLFEQRANAAELTAIVGTHTHLFAGSGTVLSSHRIPG